MKCDVGPDLRRRTSHFRDVHLLARAPHDQIISFKAMIPNTGINGLHIPLTILDQFLPKGGPFREQWRGCRTGNGAHGSLVELVFRALDLGLDSEQAKLPGYRAATAILNSLTILVTTAFASPNNISVLSI